MTPLACEGPRRTDRNTRVENGIVNEICCVYRSSYVTEYLYFYLYLALCYTFLGFYAARHQFYFNFMVITK
jgi:hypothetical protein